MDKRHAYRIALICSNAGVSDNQLAYIHDNLEAKRDWFALDAGNKPALEVVLYAASNFVASSGGVAAVQRASGCTAVHKLPAGLDASVKVLGAAFDEVWCMPLTGFGSLNKSCAARIYYCAQISAPLAPKFKLIECKVVLGASLFINVKQGERNANQSTAPKLAGNSRKSASHDRRRKLRRK